MRLTLLFALALLAGVNVGQGAKLTCSKDADCPTKTFCCQEIDNRPFSDRDAGVCATNCGYQKNIRLKRSIGVVFRALSNIIKTLAQWYKRRGVGSTTSTGLLIVSHRGGYRQAQRDFDQFVSRADIQFIRQFRGGRVAFGKDGSRMIVRQMSYGRPTLELQNTTGRAIIKYRYDP